MKRLALVFSVLLLAPSAAADVDPRPDNLKDCLREAGGVSMAVDFCLGDEAERLEATLTAAYEKALSIAEESQRGPLEQSQKDFVAYRESWCSAKSDFLGSGRNEYRGQCMIRTTRERIEALEGFDRP